MKTLRLTVAALALVSSNIFAQAPVDAEQKAAIKDLLDALNFKFMMTQMSAAMSQGMPQMMDQMVEGMSAGKLTAEQKAEARATAAAMREKTSRQLSDLFTDPVILQGMEDIVSQNYAKHFSTGEIRSITAFYVSPAGKKVLLLTPQIMQETMPKIVAVMQPKMQAMMEKAASDIVAQAQKKEAAKAEAAKK